MRNFLFFLAELNLGLKREEIKKMLKRTSVAQWTSQINSKTEWAH